VAVKAIGIPPGTRRKQPDGCRDHRQEGGVGRPQIALCDLGLLTIRGRWRSDSDQFAEGSHLRWGPVSMASGSATTTVAREMTLRYPLPTRNSVASLPRASAIRRWGTTHRSNRREVLLVGALRDTSFGLHHLKSSRLSPAGLGAGGIASFCLQFSFPARSAISTCRCVGRATTPVISRAFSMCR
jgi:hypothetical protein